MKPVIRYNLPLRITLLEAQIIYNTLNRVTKTATLDFDLRSGCLEVSCFKKDVGNFPTLEELLESIGYDHRTEDPDDHTGHSPALETGQKSGA